MPTIMNAHILRLAVTSPRVRVSKKIEKLIKTRKSEKKIKKTKP
jgi:hypothetical protein